MAQIRTRRMARNVSGFTLIELMISLVLGLLVVAAAGNLFFSNRQVFAATSAVNRMQENARAAYEIISRDIRGAGGNPCSPNVVSMLPVAERDPAWTMWMRGVSGTEGGASTRAAPRPDTLTLGSVNNEEIRVVSQDGPSAEIILSNNSGFEVNDVVMVCNPQVSTLFRVTNKSSNGLGHNSGAGGNIIKPFQISQKAVDEHPSDNASGYCFTRQSDGSLNPNCLSSGNAPAGVMMPVSIRWEIGNNANGGQSLYRVVSKAGGAQISRDEIAAGVQDMQVRYRMAGDNNLRNADGIAGNQWSDVVAVQVTLELEPAAGALRGRDLEGTTPGERLHRSSSTLVAIRNRQRIME